MKTHALPRPLLAAVSLAAALAFLPRDVGAEEQPTARPKTASASSESVPPGYDLEITDGKLVGASKERGLEATLGNVVDALRDRYTKANIAMSPGLAKLKISDLKLRAGHLTDELEAIRVASGGKFEWTGPGYVRGPLFDVEAARGTMGKILDKEVSIHLDNVPLENILVNLSQTSGVNIVADKSLPVLKQTLSVNLDKVRLGEFFRYMARNYGVQFQVGPELVWVTDGKGPKKLISEEATKSGLPMDPATGLPVATARPDSNEGLFVLREPAPTAETARTVEAFNIGPYLQWLREKQDPKEAQDRREQEVEKRLEELKEIIYDTLLQVNRSTFVELLSFRFHRGANLLIVTGTREAVDVTRKVVNALPGQTEFGSSGGGGGGGSYGGVAVPAMSSEAQEAFRKRYGSASPPGAPGPAPAPAAPPAPIPPR